MRTFLLAITIAVVSMSTANAQSVTLKDVVELTQSGVGDAVIIERIQLTARHTR